ncbi:hypothetical protein [Vibrio sp. THAF190c]|jgi:hypothetical protein|uniref:hypothetical protein n=1 Tax=Vibrio sp. THAF190c TaxID=2587865 RepID=UPI0012684661|nr:hypothetical protein [Vibrio sp. THAF190c]QFT13315.1 hypothetical protein FIV04_25530 [Vibrio sp. THAF190c]
MMANLKVYGNELVILPESLDEHADLNEFLVSIQEGKKSVTGKAVVTKSERGEFGQFSIVVEKS